MRTSAAPKRNAAYWRRLVIVALLLLTVGLLSIPVVWGFQTMYSLTTTACVTTPTPHQYGLPHEVVTFPSGDLTLTAYFIPASTDATVIIAPPFNQDHGGQMDYAQVFHNAGLNVLVLGSRVCLGQPTTLGYAEGDDVTAAYTYLLSRDGINPQRVSVHGFSAGGAAALFGAARTPQIRAVSAMGNYHDMEANVGANDPTLSPILRLHLVGLRWGFRAGTGMPLSQLAPIHIMDDINPRPVLLIYGTQEPQSDGRALAAAATNSTLWEVPGVGHGGYLQAYPQDTQRILGGFHANALLSD